MCCYIMNQLESVGERYRKAFIALGYLVATLVVKTPDKSKFPMLRIQAARSLLALHSFSSFIHMTSFVQDPGHLGEHFTLLLAEAESPPALARLGRHWDSCALWSSAGILDVCV